MIRINATIVSTVKKPMLIPNLAKKSIHIAPRMK